MAIKNSPAESLRQELIFSYLNNALGDLLKTKSAKRVNLLYESKLQNRLSQRH